MPLALQKTIFFIMHLFCFWAVAQEDSRFNESLEAYLRKDYQKAEKILVPLAQENPEKSLYWFNLGTSQYMLKRYSLAVASFDKVIKLDKTFVVMANVYKAKSLKKLGRNEEAKILLETQLQKATLPSGFKKLALLELQELQSIDSAEDSALEKYREGSFSESESRLNGVGAENLSIDGRILFILTKLKQNNSFETERYIEDQLKSLALTVSQRKVFSDLLRKSKQDDKTYAPKWLFVDVSYGQTSNVYYDGLSISPTASPIVRSTVGGGFHFNSQNPLSQKISYRAFYEQTQKAQELSSLSHALQATILHDQSSRSLNGSMYFVSQNTNNLATYDKLGFNSRSVFVYQQTDLLLEWDYAKTTAKQSSLDFLQGSNYFLKSAYGLWGASTYGQFFVLLGRDQIADINYSDGSRLPQAKDYATIGLNVLKRFSEKAYASTGFSLARLSFKSVVLPDSKIRTDNETAYFLKLNYTLYLNFNVYLTYDTVLNRSTLGENDTWDKNYNINTTSAGFVWDAF